jgi:class 3 adenylate cyclase
MVVPDHIAKELVEHVRRRRDGIAVLEGRTLIDMCDFTAILSTLTPEDVVCFVGEFFALLDEISDKYPNITKIKTIGDSYFAVAGLSEVDNNNNDNNNGDDNDDDSDNVSACSNLCSLISFCLEAQEMVAKHRFHGRSVSSPQGSLEHNLFDGEGYFQIRLRIGIHCGDVVAGVVGKKQPVGYCLWIICCAHLLICARVCSNTMFGDQHATWRHASRQARSVVAFKYHRLQRICCNNTTLTSFDCGNVNYHSRVLDVQLATLCICESMSLALIVN